MTTDTPLSIEAITDKQKETWATGDFNQIARQNWVMAEALVERVDPHPGERVLDVACGSGTAALVAARRYCEVTGIDYVESLVKRAKDRSRVSGLDASFRVADAQALPFPDDSFDVVLSVFGVQFVPDQEQAALELSRVTRPGGTIGLAGPMPGTLAGDMFKVIGEHAPPPPGVDPPLRWASDEGLEALFGGRIRSIEKAPRSGMAYWRSIHHAWEVFSTYFGPIVKALDALDPEGQRALEEDFKTVFERHNRADDGTAMVENGYMEILVRT